MIVWASTYFFFPRKIYRIRRGIHKHFKFWSFKHYSADLFEETVTSIIFPNYPNFNDATETYDDFIQKIVVAFDKISPIKKRGISHKCQEWFGNKISEAIKSRDKLVKKFVRSRLHIEKELYNATPYKVYKLIFN